MRPIDTLYTIKFIKLLTTAWINTEAYHAGIIDSFGNFIATKPLTPEQSDIYSPFVKLVFNIKRIIQKSPIAPNLLNITTALYLLKENTNTKEYTMILESLNNFISEDSCSLPANNTSDTNIEKNALPMKIKSYEDFKKSKKAKKLGDDSDKDDTDSTSK